MTSKKGFTLVELLAVIAILSILILLIVPSITNVTKSNKETLLEAKIKTIEKAGEKYGNSEINNYQNCINGTPQEMLKSDCTVEISKLINYGYMEGDNKSSQIIDPVSNDVLSGNVLLCYDPSNVNIYASYIDNDTYSCKAISPNSTNTMNLSSVGGTSYVGGNPVSVNIISSGTFTFRCSSSLSSLATCRVDNSTHKLTITPSKTFSFDSNSDSKEVIITVYGDYKNSDNTTSTLTKVYTLKVYPSSMSIDESKNNVCIETGKTESVNITGVNLGPISIEASDKNILDGTTKNNVLYVTAGSVTGVGKLTLTEGNGNNKVNFVNHVYNLSVSGVPDDIVVNKNAKVTLNYSGTGNITVTSNSDSLKLSNSTSGPASTITLKDGETSFKIIGNTMGEALLTIKGSDCGEYSKTVNVTNLVIEDNTNDIIYINGSSIKINVITEDNTLSCYSSNESAARCMIDGTSVEIFPGFEESNSTTITVRNNSGGRGTISVKTLRTSIDIVDANNNPLETVCLAKGTLNNSSKAYVKGNNLGTITLPDFDDYFYLSESSIVTSGGRTEIGLSPRNIPVDQAVEPYNPGYNTGQSVIKVKESNGNQITTFNYNIYTISASSLAGTVNVDSTLTLDVYSSATGEINATSSNSDIASIEKIDNDTYDWEVNAQNTAKIIIKGKKVGRTTVTITGADCGKLTYTVRVTGKTFGIVLEKGTYTRSLATYRLSCTTESSNKYCDVTFPAIYPQTNFTSSGYSTVPDSAIAMYKPGDTIRITNANNGTVYYGNSIDDTNPLCTFENTVDRVYLNQETDLVVKCTDAASGISSNATLSADNFTISNNNVAKIVSVSAPTRITNGNSYTVKLQGLSYGNFTVTLNEDSVRDAFDLGNASVTSSSISSFEYTPVEVWNIGATSRPDVMAVLYSNLDYLSVNDGNYTLKIYGSGAMLNFTSSTYSGGGWRYSPWYSNYKSTITNVVIDENVTNIGDYAFYTMDNLSSITFSNTINSIGNYAFYQTNLSELVLPNSINTIGNNAFKYNESISSLVIPSSLEAIGDSAFYGVPLSSLTFETNSQLKTIGNSAFADAHTISTLTIPASVESIGNYAFMSSYEEDGETVTGTITLTSLTFESGSHIKTIGTYAFYKNSIVSLTIPASLESIGSSAFAQYTTNKMTTLSFESNSKLKEISSYAFYGIKVSSLSLPDSLTTIGDYAFGNDSDVSTLKIGPNVSSIGKQFLSGGRFYAITVDENNSSYASYQNVLYTKDLTTLVRCPDAYYNYRTTLETPESLTTFAPGAFGGWYFWGDYSIRVNLYANFTTLNTSDNKFSIVNYFNISDNDRYKSESGFIYSKNGSTLYAIPGVYSSSSYTVLDGTTSIYKSAGEGAVTIKKITLPRSIVSVQDYAFYSIVKEEINPIAFSEININSTSTLSYTKYSFAVPTNYTYTPTRTLNVSDSTLRDKLASTYSSENYIINYVGS